MRHGRAYLNAGIGVYPPAGGVVPVSYTDVVTGTILLSGTRGEASARSESRSGQITLTGTRVEGKVGTDVRSGQITLTGTRTDIQVRSESRSGTVFLTGTRVESFQPGTGPTYNDTSTGTVFLSGTRTDAQTRSESRTGTVSLSGTRVESSGGPVTHSDHPTGTIFLRAPSDVPCLFPSLATFPSLQTYPACSIYNDSPRGTIHLTGSRVEGYVRGDAVLSWLRVREKPSLNQSVMVTTPTGKVYRWGEDDPVPEKSFHDLTYGSGVPGGFDQMTATLPRKRGVDYPDLELFENVQVFNAGGEVTGEYRLDSAPVTAGNDFVITPNAVGYQAALEDRKNAAVVYVDIDLSHWGQISSNMQIESSGNIYQPPQVLSDSTSGAPTVQTGWAIGDALAAPWSAAEYDAGSFCDLGSLYYYWTRNSNIDYTDAGYVWHVGYGTSDANYSDFTFGGDQRSAGPGTGTLTLGALTRFALAEFYYNPPSAGWDSLYAINWFLAVYGDHGLTKHGTPSATEAEGFYASDIIEHVVSNFTDLNIGTIDVTSSFVIPHLEFRQPTTPAAVVTAANRFHLFDWFVGPGQKFHYRERGTYGRSWLARVGPSKLEGTGQTTERCVTDVLVSYQDVDGTPKTVGPVGSNAEFQDASLHNSDTQNPANVAGVESWATLDMGQVSTPAAAIQVGARFLEEVNQFDHSGRAELTGHVMNDAGVLFPYSSVQAGDSITFVDAADTSPRRIVKATKGSNAVSIDLDAPPEGINVLLEGLGVQWTNLGALGAPEITQPGTLIRGPTPFGTAGANIKDPAGTTGGVSK